MFEFGKKLSGMLGAALLAALLLCSCTEVEEDTPETVSETVHTEGPYPVAAGLLIFEESPATVASLSPAVTEIICELGFGDRLIGVSDYCDYPESAAGKTKLGSAANPDAEAVIRLSPELLISLSPIAKKDITAIEAAGTRVWIIDPPQSVPELYKCYEDIAAVFGGKLECTDAADKAFRPFVNTLSAANRSMDSFVYIMSPELAAAPDSTFAGSFFSSFGKNAAGENKEIALTEEELLALDPEWIILGSSVRISDLPEGLSAVENGKVIKLDEEMLARIERPTSRLSGTVEKILDMMERSESGETEDSGDDTEESSGEDG